MYHPDNTVAADVSEPAGGVAIAQAAETAVGDMGIVVNNAAYNQIDVIDALDCDTSRSTIPVNLDAYFLLAKQFVPAARRKKRGHLVTFHRAGDPRHGPVHRIQDGQGLGKRLGVSLRGWISQSASMVALSLGVIETSQTRIQMQDKLLVGRIGKPLEVAHVALFLALDKSSFVAGIDIKVDAGMAGAVMANRLSADPARQSVVLRLFCPCP